MENRVDSSSDSDNENKLFDALEWAGQKVDFSNLSDKDLLAENHILKTFQEMTNISPNLEENSDQNDAKRTKLS